MALLMRDMLDKQLYVSVVKIKMSISVPYVSIKYKKYHVCDKIYDSVLSESLK